MFRRVAICAATAALIAALVPAQPAVAQSEERDYAATRAIVGAKIGRKGTAEQSIMTHGGRVVSYSAEGQFFVVETPSDSKAWSGKVKSDGSVRYAEPDYEITAADLAPSDPSWGRLWGMDKIGMPRAWDADTGSKEIVVGVLDSGVDYRHEDLAGQMWVNPREIPGNGVDDDNNGWRDDVYGADCKNNDGDPMDDNNHGTHVAGTIGAAANNGKGVAGVNWQIGIMALKFLGSDGSGYTSDAVQCIDYAIANGAHLTNNSWGGGGFSTSLRDAIARAAADNQLFVAAAGNSGKDADSSPHYPSSYDLDNIVSVAASDSNDALASFSNYGDTSVDLAAPGVGIYSTVRGGYASYNGTSMATPHVAGAAALLLSEYTALKGDYRGLRTRIFDNVTRVPALSGKVVTGGRLDVATAMGPVDPDPTVDEPPLVAITSPGSGSTVSGTVTVTASASDDNGVTQVEFLEGGVPIGTDTNSADGWSVQWTAPTVAGTYELSAIATDSGGNVATSQPIQVVVQDKATSMHLHSISARAVALGSKDWQAVVTVNVTDNREAAVAGVRVDLTWSYGTKVSCTTDTTGTCTISSKKHRRSSTRSMTATVTGVTGGSLAYDSSANHNGSSVTVSAP
jgi:subtilisin family serine protease